MDARQPPPQPPCSSATMHGPDLDVWCSPPTYSPPEALYRPPSPETRPLCDPRTSLSAHAQKWHLGGPVSGLGWLHKSKHLMHKIWKHESMNRNRAWQNLINRSKYKIRDDRDAQMCSCVPSPTPLALAHIPPPNLFSAHNKLTLSASDGSVQLLHPSLHLSVPREARMFSCPVPSWHEPSYLHCSLGHRLLVGKLSEKANFSRNCRLGISSGRHWFTKWVCAECLSCITWGRTTWVWVPALPFAGFVTLGKFLTSLCFSFFICRMQIMTVAILQVYCWD